MSRRRGRGIIAAEGCLARPAPAGHVPINELYPAVVMAGSSLFCRACGTNGQAPLPREVGYGRAVEAFLHAHRRCAEEARP